MNNEQYTMDMHWLPVIVRLTNYLIQLDTKVLTANKRI